MASLLVSLQTMLSAHPYTAAVGGLVAFGGFLLARKKANKPKLEFKKDVVYLFGFARTPWAPSSSPFVLKLESFLRMAKIPYEVVPFSRMSKKGKIPFIIHNGVETADSSMAIEYLKSAYPELTKELEGKLDPQTAAVARAFKMMLEENTYFALMYTTWAEHGAFETCETLNIKLPFPASLFVPKIIARQLRANLHGQGMGRHTPAEVHEIGIKDFNALSSFMANKQFLMGDKPTEVDATVWGMVQMAISCPFDSPIKDRVKQLPNLTAYAARMRERWFPDWDQLLLKR